MIRVAAESDVLALAELESALFGVDAWDVDALRAELTGPGRRVVVSTSSTTGSGDAVVGYAVTMTVGATADLLRIGVHPEHQRLGVAAALLDGLLAAVRAEGADQVLLEVSATNLPAVAFYARHGFAEIDRRRRYYRDGSDALVLRRSLIDADDQG